MMTLFSMTKIWGEVFWKKDPSAEAGEVTEDVKPHRFSLAPMVLLVFAIILLSLFGEPVFEWSLEAARQLLDPSVYISSVLEEVSAK